MTRPWSVSPTMRKQSSFCWTSRCRERKHRPICARCESVSSTHVLAAISASTSRRDILQALEAGVHGYIVRSLPVADLVKALSTIFEGGVYVPPCLADFLRSRPTSEEQADERPHPQPSAHPNPSIHLLTSRQRDVLDLLVQGKTNKEIALALKLGEGTVKIHMAAIFRYFGVNNRAAAAVAGARPYPNRPRGVLNEGPSKGGGTLSVLLLVGFTEQEQVDRGMLPSNSPLRFPSHESGNSGGHLMFDISHRRTFRDSRTVADS